MPNQKVTKNSFSNFNWEFTIMNILALILTWSSVPLEYASTISTSSIKSSWGFMFTYQIGMALITILFFNKNVKNIWSTVGMVLAFLSAIFSIRNGGITIGCLMILFPLFFILLGIRQTDLHSGYGLTIYALLSSTTVPLSFIKLSSGFLSWQAVLFVIPLFLSFLFFAGPIFIRHSQWVRLIYSGTGILMILLVLIHGIGIAHIIACLIIVASWFLMISNKRPIDEFLTYSIMQMLCVLLMYWH